MSGIPTNPTKSTRLRNPHLYSGSASELSTPPKQPQCGTIFIIKHEPVPAPRMTRSDKWLNPRRPCVQRYFDYRDFLQKAVGDLPTVPHTMKFAFYFPMPESWSNKKQAEMIGQKHRQRPDSDNCIKAVMDALFIHDGGVSDIVSSKRWCLAGSERIELEIEL